jgi:hypothetical protein
LTWVRCWTSRTCRRRAAGSSSPRALRRIKKSDLKQVNFTGDDTSPIRNGKLGMIDRFTLYVSNNLAKAGVRVHRLRRHARRHFVGRPAHEGGKPALSPTTFGSLLRGLNVYGYAVTKPEALVTSVMAFA